MSKVSGSRVGVRPTTTQTTTYEGGVGYSKDTLTELFQLAVTYMGSDTFYESAEARDERFRSLAGLASIVAPDWVAALIPWLRGPDVNLRRAPLVATMEYALAGGPNPRKVISSAMARADEPAEAIDYWVARMGRHTLPGGVQRGIADAATALYTESSALKYDGSSRHIHMGDVLELTHPRPKAPWQSALFRWLLDRRHRGTDAKTPQEIMAQLPTVSARLELESFHPDNRRSFVEALLEGSVNSALRQTWDSSAPTWEWLSGWLQGPMDATAWQVIIPRMGFMAQLRNLRNFDDAGVPDDVAEQVATRLSDPDEVSRSRQMPFRFFSAWQAAQSMRWGPALEKALELSTKNIPALNGRTLVLTDTSASMRQGLSARSTMNHATVAALFAVTLAKRGNDVSLVQFASDWRRVSARPGGSVLRNVEDLVAGTGAVGYGTETFKALSESYQGEDRVIIVTDQQAFPVWSSWINQIRDPGEFVRQVVGDKPVYTFDTTGYSTGHLPSGGGFYALGGLTDATFTMIPLLEAGNAAKWPFLREDWG